MICDIPYPAPFIGNPMGYAGEQTPLGNRFGVYLGFISRLNLPPNPPVKIITKQVLAVNTASVDVLENEFDELVKQWKEETFFISSSSKLFTHPAYIKIIAMGKDGLPFVLKELQRNSGRWFNALKFMAGKDGEGVAEGVKDYEIARSAWLDWGYKNDYI